MSVGAVLTHKPTLYEARVRRSMSASVLAKLSGVAASTILKIESPDATKRPHLATCQRLAAALGVDPTAIAWPGDPYAGLPERGADHE